MIGVRTADEGFRVAAAGLPVSARLDPDSRRWIVAGHVGSGAAGVVLRAPVDVGVAVPHVPVVIVRRYLRADVAADAIAARADVTPGLIVAECHATDAGDTVVADAIGWLRVLAGGPLTCTALDRTPGAALAAFTADRVALTLIVTLGAPRSMLRVRALGETTTEVTADSAGRTTLTTSTALGAVTSPRRREHADRLALRRAIAALDGDPVTDLADLAHDTSHAASVTGAVVRCESRPPIRRVG